MASEEQSELPFWAEHIRPEPARPLAAATPAGHLSFLEVSGAPGSFPLQASARGAPVLASSPLYVLTTGDSFSYAFPSRLEGRKFFWLDLLYSQIENIGRAKAFQVTGSDSGEKASLLGLATSRDVTAQKDT